jgi:hypothetical protein
MCDVSYGRIQPPCKNSVAGLKALFIANYDADYDFVVSSGTASGHALTDLGNLTEVFKYSLKNTNNTYNQTITSSSDTGTTLYNQVLNFTLTKVSAEMEFQVKNMVWGTPQIFLEFNTGQVILLGKDRGCDVSGNAQIDGNLDGLNAYVLTATANESEPAYFLDSTSTTSLRALVSTDNLTV